MSWARLIKVATPLWMGLCFTFSATATPSKNNQDQRVELRTSEMPPYQVVINGRLQGISINTLNCAFNELEMTPSINVVPAKRAEHDVKNNLADGYFSSIKHADSDTFARLSAPLAMEKWFLVSHSESPGLDIGSLDTYRLGAIRGSNEALWLQQETQKSVAYVGGLESLLQQLAAKRIDGFVTDDKALAESASFWPGSKPRMRIQFLRYTELGVYFGRNFLAEQSGFLTEFNAALGQCQQLELRLTEDERQHLQAQVDTFFQKFEHEIVQQALEARLRNPVSDENIASYENIWRKEKASGGYNLIASIQSEPVSQFLTQLAVSQRDGFTEILLFDTKGALVGFSTVPSDYDQADEAKYQQTIGLDSDSYHLGVITYDVSTQKFQAQISKRILSPAGVVIGAVTIGLDVEFLLHGKTVPVSLLLRNE